MVTQTQKDTVYNALLVGMDPNDAYVLAGLSPEQMEWTEKDDDWQAWIATQRRSHEFSLLNRLNEIVEKQAMVGKADAVTWSLEHMYPRYSGKPQGDGKPININFVGADPKDIDTVEIHN